MKNCFLAVLRQVAHRAENSGICAYYQFPSRLTVAYIPEHYGDIGGLLSLVKR